ncbi:MAG: polysaccharide biosynthesis protein [Rhizobiales bacterium]|nr:polysaccharide biosynthesis protein [Hyphomicrobiales bacterium]
MNKYLNAIFEMDRRLKRALLLACDAAALAFSYFFALALRLDTFSFVATLSSWVAPAIVIPVSLFIFERMGFYRAVVRHISGKGTRIIFLGCILSSLLYFVLKYTTAIFIPRSLPLIYFPIAFITLAGIRVFIKWLHFQREARLKSRVVIYGAGDSGRQLLASLLESKEYLPIAFVDDSNKLHKREIGGRKVYSPDRLPWLISEFNVEMVLLAIPSATLGQRQAILHRLEPLPVRVNTVPGMADIVAGRAAVSQIQDVAIEDLLGRDPIPPDAALLDANIRGKVVMVTGAGGSIGSELCRQIVCQGVRELLLFDVSEYALYTIAEEIEQTVATLALPVRIVPLIGSVQDEALLRAVMRGHRVQTVFHAAAYKHVPLVEGNILAAVSNNVLGTLATAEAAVEAGVSAFVLISTDKAVRPTNVMGASKRMAELIIQAMAKRHGATIFSMVRFGNVLGSSGSVVPLFHRQIAAGGPITVTHPEIVRYFMTVQEAAQLVIQAGALARGGDVFVLDMGSPVRIVDLARRMVRLHGQRAVIDQEGGRAAEDEAGAIRITFSGLRPGEKLYEELLVTSAATPTSHPRILTDLETSMDWALLVPHMQRLRETCLCNDPDGAIRILQALPLGYTPSGETARAADRTGVEPPTHTARKAGAVPSAQRPHLKAQS